MTNRKRLLQTNIYDLLVSMNENLDKFDCCIMNALPNGCLLCLDSKQDCKKCIQKWLNEEAKEVIK